MTTTRIALSTTQFTESLAKHIEETKPDPLAKRQIESWSCEWTEADTNNAEPTNVTPDLSLSHCNETAVCNVIRGTLSLTGDYMTLLLNVNCQWTWDQEQEKNGIGTMEFVLHVGARFQTKSELKKYNAETTKTLVNNHHHSKEDIDSRIRGSMLKRLQNDDYISKLLGDEFQPLCHANIFTKKDELEERVWMDEDLLESIRRSIYSKASSVIDIVELLTSFPYLGVHCPLGNRAKLRLLEDAMLDECEREGEDELINDLSLQKSKEEPDNEELSKRVRKKNRSG